MMFWPKNEFTTFWFNRNVKSFTFERLDWFNSWHICAERLAGMIWQIIFLYYTIFSLSFGMFPVNWNTPYFITCSFSHPQSWADAFRSSPSLVGVVYVYDDLKKRGLEFPMTDLDALSPIHTPNRVRQRGNETWTKLLQIDLCTNCAFVANLTAAFIFQSIPENGTHEPTPVAPPTQQSQPQAPSGAPAQNAPPPVQPNEGPASLSAEQVPLPLTWHRAAWETWNRLISVIGFAK